jgi:hypothetical protein
MKATTKMMVLAVAVAAALAAPAIAFAGPGLHDMAIGQQLAMEPVLATPVIDSALVAHVVLDPEYLHIITSEDTTIGEPPEAHKEPVLDVVATHEDTPTMMIPDDSSNESTPATHLDPREPRLPFTGDDATPWMVGGLLVILGGLVWMAAAPKGRKSRARVR